MANEITISCITGLTVTVQLYSAGVAVGSPISTTEIGSTGEYIADMPTVGYGRYLLIAMAGTAKLASGEIMWDGANELIDGIAKIQRLDPNNPLTVTPTTMDTGDIHIDISGDGETSSIFTRS
jgi:hypothetical protein